jgi:hypothetical protein
VLHGALDGMDFERLIADHNRIARRLVAGS